jgi:peptidoglycan/LPS O-acetylase OafA/YrhL
VRRFVAGDPLRGLACLAVIAVHTADGALWATGYGSGPNRIDYYHAFGGFIDYVLLRFPTVIFLFFALSGYLIARPFVRAFVLDRPLPSIRTYAFNRALRILPALWLTIGLILLVIPQERVVPAGDVLSRLALVSSFSHGPLAGVFGQVWSIRTEAAFYIAMPLIALLVWRLAGGRFGERGRRRIVLAGCVLVSVECLVVLGLGPEKHVDFVRSPHVIGLAFCPGVALAAYECDPDWRPVRHWAVALLLMLLGLTAVAFNPVMPHMWLVFALATIGCGLVVAVLLLREREGAQGPVERMFASAPLQWLGSRSYPIFLVHMAVMAELYPLIRHASGYKVGYAILFPATVAVTLVVAELMHRAVERPFLRYRERRRRVAPAVEPLPLPAAP